MNKDSVIRLPWLESLSRSLGYFLVNLKNVFAIVALGMFLAIYESFAGTPLFCSMLQAQNCSASTWAYIGIMCLITVFSAYVMTAFSRFIILKDIPHAFSFRFGKREQKVLGYQLLTDIIPGIVFSQILGFLILYVEQHPESFLSMMFMPILLAIIIAMILLSRFSLVWSGSAVDNDNMTLKKSFDMTQGNTNKIFWGYIVISLPMIFLMSLLNWFVSLIGAADLLIRIIYSALLMLLMFMNVALKASFNAHIYQYFVYFYRKRIEDSEAAALSE